MTTAPKPSRKIVIDPWRIERCANGRALYFIVPGYTHIICTDN